MFSALACRILKHRVDRRRVWHDSIDYRTSCARCAVPMVRGLGGWREFDPSRDEDLRREPHPRHR